VELVVAIRTDVEQPHRGELLDALEAAAEVAAEPGERDAAVLLLGTGVREAPEPCPGGDVEVLRRLEAEVVGEVAVKRRRTIARIGVTAVRTSASERRSRRCWWTSSRAQRRAARSRRRRASLALVSRLGERVSLATSAGKVG